MQSSFYGKQGWLFEACPSTREVRACKIGKRNGAPQIRWAKSGQTGKGNLHECGERERAAARLVFSVRIGASGNGMQPAQHACPAAQFPAPQRGTLSFVWPAAAAPYSQGRDSACFLFVPAKESPWQKNAMPGLVFKSFMEENYFRWKLVGTQELSEGYVISEIVRSTNLKICAGAKKDAVPHN